MCAVWSASWTTLRLPAHEETAARLVRGRMTELDDASVASRWQPILSGATAEQALQAVDDVAESIASMTSAAQDPSLGRGEAGLALLYTWLARARRRPQADVLAWQ